ncbi:MAG: formate dehydrogenase accessory sulfurtransferase FdhD [Lutibacter sp.]|uniref:formate dehydrogenase accessory sulfurtransferase FdhD n=1 Tax=Lutibacter sp. TaxID=1925666 RepID=UPI0019F7A375|nr:formate dehydrogenase accessory sulfurtransferase FdhD [Lutibacter sp.]NOR29246.1 formate dehydrogenase accessory sulfurtransferase FdhD [Lutibacter sp.]
MQTLKYEGLLLNNGDSKKVNDTLVIEAALQININSEPYTVVMRTPGDDFELIRGLLYAEDIYKNKKNLTFEIIENRENGFSIINVPILGNYLGKGYLNKRTLLSVSSCGICGKQKLEDINVIGEKLIHKISFNTKKLKQLFSEMKDKQETFDASGGSHAAALIDKDYQIIALKEDIGRHNAVDKAIGELLINNSLNNVNCILVSGRVSYEIISKAFIAKIPIVVAVSACSSLAVDFAKEFGITLIGFSRGNKATIYSK